MKSETEIRQKLESYEQMLSGMEAGQEIANPDIFLTFRWHFPGEAMELLGSASRAEMQSRGCRRRTARGSDSGSARWPRLPGRCWKPG